MDCPLTAPPWLPGRGDQLGQLRRWLGRLLPAGPARDDVVVVAVELATNAVAHTASGCGGWFTVEVSWQGSAVRVAVADQGAQTGPRAVGDLDSENGRGLLVVRGLSARTGVCGDERGRTVWAEVPWAGEGAAARLSPPEGCGAVVCQDGAAGPQHRAPGVRAPWAPMPAGIHALVGLRPGAR